MEGDIYLTDIDRSGRGYEQRCLIVGIKPRTYSPFVFQLVNDGILVVVCCCGGGDIGCCSTYVTVCSGNDRSNSKVKLCSGSCDYYILNRGVCNFAKLYVPNECYRSGW